MRKVESRGWSARRGPDRMAPNRHRFIAEDCMSSPATAEAGAAATTAPNGLAPAIVGEGMTPARLDGTKWCSCAGASDGADSAPS